MPHRASLFVDAHVHFYVCFSEHLFFESANTNFGNAAASDGDDTAMGCLCFTECATDNYFNRLAESMKIDSPEWTVRPTEESISLVACRQDQPRILLIAGRQIITSERLEVLALGTGAEFEDGSDLEETISRALEAAATVVLPWGFGKWWFERGQIVQDFLRNTKHSRIFVGDNGGRPESAPPSPLFALAAERGYWMLPGSDSLPLSQQVSRTGNFGFKLEDVSDLGRPAESLKRRMNSLAAQPQLFGGRVGLANFFWSQLALHLTG